MERIVKGIWIPIEIWEAEDLSWNEKILLMEIDSFTKRGRDCFISNEHIGELLGVAPRTARQYLSHLIDLELVKLVKFDGRARYVESNLQSLPGRVAENCQAEWQNSATQTGENLPHTNTSYLNTKTDKEKEIYKERKPQFDLYKALLAEGVNAATAHDWLQVRKTKRLANTETGWRETLAEIVKTGKSAEYCIRTAIAQGWGGFRADWLDRLLNGTGPARPRKVDNVTYMVEQMEARMREQQRQYNPNDDLPDEQ